METAKKQAKAGKKGNIRGNNGNTSINSNITSGGGGSSRGISRVSNSSWSVAVGVAAPAEASTASMAAKFQKGY